MLGRGRGGGGEDDKGVMGVGEFPLGGGETTRKPR